MVKAFVFGKFLPFHKGHEAMIRFALQHCDVLSIMVCEDSREHIPGELRKSWIESTFPDHRNIEIKVFPYDHEVLPNSSETSASISEIWAAEFRKHYPDHTLLITSEPYGELVARFMGIKHIPFDPDKQQVPVSATMIRSDTFTNWQHLPDAVKPHFALMVVILGTESTGKTTLTEQLAHHFNCSYVLEAGRDLIPDSTRFKFDDLLLVANEHAKRINTAVKGDSGLVIIDTDIHITASYAQFAFGKELPVPTEIYNANKANLYLYLDNDVPYYQDGTRLAEAERDQLDRSHRKVLAAHNINITEISGDWPARFEQAVAAVSQLIKNNTTL
ncbi:cytidyltransferase [Mucilaginibacter conchicola]|uniref:Cytidyltransferase n=1 Tax=Mucilaginibacter conchicola TaxID=2303333 RepID=A0A372NT75_9SPHI|nr:AAA family ATPase [Mucilaginibacter conchicola]RFZ92483.1 cytidyltransferase [Mucilaginibacter conchicola]